MKTLMFRKALVAPLIICGLVPATVTALPPAISAGVENANPAGTFQITIETLHTLGRSDAPITLLEFSDYTCRFCRLHNVQTMPLIVDEYIRTGLVRYIVEELPSREPTSSSFEAAHAALCAGDQGKYWEMRQALYEDSQPFKMQMLEDNAVHLGLDISDFTRCMNESRHVELIQKTIRHADETDIRQIPKFYLGATAQDHPNVLDVRAVVTGAKSFEVFRQTIDAVLTSVGETAAPK